MSITDIYAAQYPWRSWSELIIHLPNREGSTILDLGCGIGDLSRDLCERGANVIGVDANAEVIEYARSRGIKNSDFRVGDLVDLSCIQESVDGIWSSFAAAYFPNRLCEVLKTWNSKLNPGGWIALTEIDEMFGHEPFSVQTRQLLDGYVSDALANSRYDFCMGRKLAPSLIEAGFVVQQSVTVPDQEFSFSGQASQDVIAAWQARFDGMFLLKQFCGSEFDAVRDDFLNCLRSDHHSSKSTVCFCLGVSENQK